MGSIGAAKNNTTATESKYPPLPNNPTYFRERKVQWDGTVDITYYLVDKKAEPEFGWEKPALYQGYRIEPFYAVHTHFSSGRSGYTKYWVVKRGSDTIQYLDTLKEAKEYLEGRKWEV